MKPMSQFERFGYFFHPSKYSPPLGHATVDVFLALSEDGWFFPTRSATFPVVDETGITHLTVAHAGASARRDYKLAPGLFYIVAWDGDLVEGFTFGGDLTVECTDDHVCCQLRSAAPIFDLADTTGLVEILAPEFEAELARLRADWTETDDGFDRVVVMLDAFALFVASLHLSDTYVHRLPAMDSDDTVLDGRQAVSHAIRILQHAGEWPDKPATLHQLIFDD